ncbi:ArsR/SmtB family transcription factor [Fervidibacillus albus]|uniref:Metalloregulator ArsR/SmtB family transcription factor n=1 Tax=Fervidibacillus albus TaxID=2980026 RepID=A0A9E8RWS9_9BACI|nr:metalloregulator ArsR/SmtB family transcription factor [Fervidibacillus albus]WAA08747.1 metalloregulator ArsR/SmtB family transcription factor [Fervidibacillus albus]
MEKDYRSIASVMKALSDPTRLKIIDLLSDGEQCACNMLENFSITQPTLSYHMKMLTESGLVRARKDGIWMKYSINREQLDEVVSFFQQTYRTVVENVEDKNCCVKKAVN